MLACLDRAAGYAASLYEYFCGLGVFAALPLAFAGHPGWAMLWITLAAMSFSD